MKKKEALPKKNEEHLDQDAPLKKEVSKISSILGERGWYSFYRAVEQNPASIIITDTDGNIEYVNPKFESLTGYSREEVLGQNPRLLKSGETSSDEYENLWKTITAGKTWRGEFHNRKKNGELYWEHASISGLLDDEGKVTHYVAVKEDITERKAMDMELRMMSQAVEQSPASIVITDTAGDILYVNQKFAEATGYAPEEVIGRNPRILKSGLTPQREYRRLWETITAGRVWHGEFRNRKKSGEKFWEYAAVSPIMDAEGRILYYLAVKEDITERKEMDQMLESAYQTIHVHQSRMLDELNQARETQLALLPDALPTVPGAHIAFKYVPMEQIGGDYYNVFQIDEHRYGIVIADVSGHGVPAALISIMLSAVANESCRAGHSPKTIMDEANDLLFEKLPSDKFVSLIYSIYDVGDRSLTYAVGGHPEGLIYRPDTGELFKLETEGSLVGAMPTRVAEFEERKIQLETGDRILLYTDAIIEALNDDKEAFGLDRLVSFFCEKCTLPIDELMDMLYDDVLAFSGRDSFNDDVTLIGLEVLTPSE